MIIDIKGYKLANGKKISERLETEYPEGTWSCTGEEMEFIYRVSGMKWIFSWGLKDGKIVALSASASRITPELNPNQITYKQMRETIQGRELAIYDYFNSLFAQGYSDEESVVRTAKKFGVDLNTVHETVSRVSEILHL